MGTQQRYHRYFRIGHVNISLLSKNRNLIEVVGDWMKGFEVATDTPGSHEIRFTLVEYEQKSHRTFTIPSTAELVHTNQSTNYYDYRGLWIAHVKPATILVSRFNHKMVAFVPPDMLHSPIYLDDFMHPLLELLRQSGVYAHHAGAVSLDDFGLLIVGQSGQGKTTLSVDLLSHGFDFLADDRCFVTEGEEGPEVLGFYEPIRYFASNVDHIQAIQASASIQNLPKLSNDKHQLDVSQIFHNQIIKRSRLSALVFPFFSPAESVSRIEHMTQGEAMCTLLPLTMVCFDRDTSKSHFAFCAKLTSTLPSVRMIMGRDRERWHTLMEEYVIPIGANAK